MSKQTNKAFSLVELSIVILIIGVLISAVGQGIELYEESQLSGARMVTQGSRVNSIKNLVAWFETTSEASFDTIEAEDGLTVTNWYGINPQVVVKATARQTTGASKPKYVRNCINSLPCLDFDGVDDALSSIEEIGATRGGLSVFAVVKFDSIVNGGNSEYTIVSSGTSWGSGKSFILKVWEAGTATFQYQLPEQGIGSIPDYTPVFSDTSYMVEAINDLNGTSIWINGDAGTSYAGVPMTDIETLYIGHYNSARYMDGKIGEIIVFDRVVTTKERTAIERYLKKKWKI